MEEQNFSLYLSGVKMKYWDNLILLGNYWNIFFSDIDSLLGKGRQMEML